MTVRRRGVRKVAPVVAMPHLERPENALAHLAAALAVGNVRGVIVTIIPRTKDRGGMMSVYCGQVDGLDCVWVGQHIIREGMV